MTDREICEKIVKQRNCNGIACSNCPFKEVEICHDSLTITDNAKQWLEDHKEEEVTDIERLEKVIDEAKAQIEAIKRKEKEEKRIVFDPDNLYCCCFNHNRFILTGTTDGDFRFSSLDSSMGRLHKSFSQGQAALDYATTDLDLKIHVFNNRREALEWMLEE